MHPMEELLESVRAERKRIIDRILERPSPIPEEEDLRQLAMIQGAVTAIEAQINDDAPVSGL
jgi:hypothetical protein